MKTILTTIIALILATIQVSGTTNTAVTGDWGDISTWSLGRLPTTNDSIRIPVAVVVDVKNTITLTNVVIVVYGRIEIQGKLELSATSSVIVHTGGMITANSNGSAHYITIGGVDKFVASDPDFSGPRYADASTPNSPNGFANFAVLPVQLLSFTITNNAQQNQVSWSTANESNNKYFELQRTNDGNNWISVAIIRAASSTENIKNYSYADKNAPSGISSYRLRQVDEDGQEKYSHIISIRVAGTNNQATIYASNKTITIKFNSELKSQAVVKLFTMNGNVVTSLAIPKGSSQFSINTNEKPGIYLVQVSDTNGFAGAKQIIL